MSASLNELRSLDFLLSFFFVASEIGAGGNFNTTRTGHDEVKKTLRLSPGPNKDGSWFLNLRVLELK